MAWLVASNVFGIQRVVNTEFCIYVYIFLYIYIRYLYSLYKLLPSMLQLTEHLKMHLSCEQCLQ